MTHDSVIFLSCSLQIHELIIIPERKQVVCKLRNSYIEFISETCTGHQNNKTSCLTNTSDFVIDNYHSLYMVSSKILMEEKLGYVCRFQPNSLVLFVKIAQLTMCFFIDEHLWIDVNLVNFFLRSDWQSENDSFSNGIGQYTKILFYLLFSLCKYLSNKHNRTISN